MRSMTGFGQARAENERIAVSVSLRAVNSRHLDLVLRLREEHRVLERPLRDLLAGELRRGRVEVGLEIRPLGERPVEVEVQRGAVRAIRDAVDGLRDEGLVEGPLTVESVLRLPDTVTLRVAEESWHDDDTGLVVVAAGEALAQLVRARSSEGEKLAVVLEEKVDALAGLAGELDELRHAAREEAVAALRKRVAEMLGDQPLDDGRLEQEIVLLTDRSDVSEEIDRLGAHLDHFREVYGRPGAVGKRLDFLAQELFRELNTLGAKCRHPEVTRRVLDAKVLCEQIREQIQNVE